MLETLGCPSDPLYHLPSKPRALEAPKEPQLFYRSTRIRSLSLSASTDPNPTFYPPPRQSLVFHTKLWVSIPSQIPSFLTNSL